jgi:hypothetical protein
MRIQVGLPNTGCLSDGGAGDGSQSGEINFQAPIYWSGSEFAPNPNNAWNFNFNNGNQNANNKNNNNFGWAVRSGA